MTDVNGVTIGIGDIVQVKGSPNKSQNAMYVVARDGFHDELYSGRDSLTMYKVVKNADSYALSNGKYNIEFFPLCNFSSRYKYSRNETAQATIEILVQAVPNRLRIKNRDTNKFLPAENPKDYYWAAVNNGDRQVTDVSYLVSDEIKLRSFFSFFSNLTLKKGQTLEVVKHVHDDNNDFYWRKGVAHQITRVKQSA